MAPFQTTVGALSGGATAELGGGKFMQGMGQGARTAAFAFIFNEMADLVSNAFHPLEPVPVYYLSTGSRIDYGLMLASGTDPYAAFGPYPDYFAMGVGALVVAPELAFFIMANPETALIPAASAFTQGLCPGPPGAFENWYEPLWYLTGFEAGNFASDHGVNP